jgi:DNA-binding NarL/FixJ family response regulator
MAKQAKIRVFVIDDHDAVRVSLRYFLLSTDDMCLVGEAGSVAQALPLIATLRPDVVVMDPMMPGEDGLSGTRQLCRYFPQVRVMVLTAGVEDVSEQQARDAGAAGYVSKDATSGDLAAAIRAVVLA